MPIAAHPDDVETAPAEYERALFPRSTAAATGSARNLELMFGDDTPRSLLDLLTGYEKRP